MTQLEIFVRDIRRSFENPETDLVSVSLDDFRGISASEGDMERIAKENRWEYCRTSRPVRNAPPEPCFLIYRELAFIELTPDEVIRIVEKTHSHITFAGLTHQGLMAMLVFSVRGKTESVAVVEHKGERFGWRITGGTKEMRAAQADKIKATLTDATIRKTA